VESFPVESGGAIKWPCSRSEGDKPIEALTPQTRDISIVKKESLDRYLIYLFKPLDSLSFTANK
jgi:hypothetical protein